MPPNSGCRKKCRKPDEVRRMGGKNAENFEAKEKRGMTDFPKRE